MPIKIKHLNNNVIIISWQRQISTQTSREIFNYWQAISKQFSELIVDSVPTYCDLTIYTKSSLNFQLFKKELIQLYFALDKYKLSPNQHWDIPVCYDDSFGIDLTKISKALNLSVETIISIHSKPVYQIDFLGFLPGFPYLSGLNSQISMPRRDTPRIKIAQGSVAIGGKQTGIYPVSCPSGWNIIGKTPNKLFNNELINPCLLSPMDTLKFIPISLQRFHKLV